MACVYTLHTFCALIVFAFLASGVMGEEASHTVEKGDAATEKEKISGKENVQNSSPNVDGTNRSKMTDNSASTSLSSDGAQNLDTTKFNSDKNSENQSTKENPDEGLHDKNSDSEINRNDTDNHKSGGPNKDSQSTNDTDKEKSGDDPQKSSVHSDNQKPGNNPNERSDDVDKQKSGSDQIKKADDIGKQKPGAPDKKSDGTDKQESGDDPNQKSGGTDKQKSGGDPNQKSDDTSKQKAGSDPNQKSDDTDKQKSGGDPNIDASHRQESDGIPKQNPEDVKTQDHTDCNNNHSCGDGKKMLACLHTTGEGKHELSLLVQNKGDTSLHVEVATPTFLSADPSVPLVIDKGKSATVKLMVIDSKAGEHTELPMINIKGDFVCSIEVPTILNSGNLSKRKFFQGISYPYMTKHILLVYILLFVLAGTAVGTWLSCRYSRKRWHGDGVRYQELEVGSIHEQAISKPEEVLDGWDEVWDEDWEDTEAARLTSRPIQSVSSNGLASRRANKEGWETSWDD